MWTRRPSFPDPSSQHLPSCFSRFPQAKSAVFKHQVPFSRFHSIAHLRKTNNNRATHHSHHRLHLSSQLSTYPSFDQQASRCRRPTPWRSRTSPLRRLIMKSRTSSASGKWNPLFLRPAIRDAWRRGARPSRWRDPDHARLASPPITNDFIQTMKSHKANTQQRQGVRHPDHHRRRDQVRHRDL